jgi:signal transduction histidine kinase
MASGTALARIGERALASSEMAVETGVGDGSRVRVALLLPGDTGPVGALVLENPSHWNTASRSFAQTAARSIAASLQAARKLGETRLQGELLARRNLELETLRELAGKLQALETEDSMLQAALELVLEKLGLTSGWIFWGEAGQERLRLAAHRGVSGMFVRRSREDGIGECLCQDVFSTGQQMFARNTTDCPRLPHLIQGETTSSHACIPLKFERGSLGVLNITSRPGQLFSPHELQFLETVGTQLCLAVDKVRTSRAETRRNAEARALAALSRAIGGSLDQKRVLEAVGDYARDLLSADRCAIFLGDGSGPFLFAYLTGPPMEGIEVGRHADFNAMGSQAFPEVARQKKTLVFQDVQRDPRGNPELARKWNVGSAILEPLLVRESMKGVVLVSRSEPSPWSREEIELANALTGQAALAIENALLYREAQDAVRHLQRAQYGMMRAERMAAVGTLASSLAHEVRNPLNSINLQLVLLSRRVAKLDEVMRGELSDLVDTAHREIARLDGLVEEFLSLSSIDQLSLTEESPGDIVHELLDLMAPVTTERGIILSEAADPSLPDVRIDREKIKQVLLNLARNAVEAMPHGGSLKVTTRLVNGSVVISLSDTGSGIEPGLDVFGFFKTTKPGGTGLGLPISRRIVEAHGGSLTYESEPGKGTTFSVIFKSPEAEPDS